MNHLLASAGPEASAQVSAMLTGEKGNGSQLGLYRGRECSLAWTGPAPRDGEAMPYASGAKKSWRALWHGRLRNAPALFDRWLARKPGTPHHPAALLIEMLRAGETAALAEMRGAFQFVVWDGESRTRWFGTDHAGQQRLYYRVRDGHCAVVSHPWALARLPNCEPRLDHAAYAQMLAFGCVLGARTVCTGIRRLVPGYVGRFCFGRLTFVPLGDTTLPKTPPLPTPRERLEAAYHLLDTSVASSLRDAQAPRVVVDGGADSALLAVLARYHHPDVRLLSLAVDPPGDWPQAHKGSSAPQLARWLQLPLDVATVPGPPDEPAARSAWARQWLDASLQQTSVPILRPSALGDAWWGEAIARFPGGTILRDVGVDAVFGSLPRLRTFRRLRRVAGMLRLPWWPVRQVLSFAAFLAFGAGRGASTGMPMTARWLHGTFPRSWPARMPTLATLLRLLREGSGLADMYRAVRECTSGEVLADLLPAASSAPEGVAMALARYLPPDAATLPESAGLMRMEQVVALRNFTLPTNDGVRQACGVEVALPYLAAEVRAFAAGLPLHETLDSPTGKGLLNTLARQYLPPHAAEAEPPPDDDALAHWWLTALSDAARERLFEITPVLAGVLQRPAVEMLWRRYCAGDRSLALPVWTLLAANRWFALHWPA